MKMGILSQELKMPTGLHMTLLVRASGTAAVAKANFTQAFHTCKNVF